MWTRGNTIGVSVAGAAVVAAIAVMSVIVAMTPSAPASSASWPGTIVRVGYLDFTGSVPPRFVDDEDALAQVTSVLERNDWTPQWRQRTTGCGSRIAAFAITFDDDSTSELYFAEGCDDESDRFATELADIVVAAPAAVIPAVPGIREVAASRTGTTPGAAWSATFDEQDDAAKIAQVRELLLAYGWNRAVGLPPETTSTVCPPDDVSKATVTIFFDDGAVSTMALPEMCEDAPTAGSLGAELNALVAAWAAEDGQ